MASVPPGTHPDGYCVERRALGQVEVFGRAYRLPVPFDARLLFDPDGRLWMSDTPQERIMMVNNGRASSGHVLVGGLGLGLYPQFAAEVGAAERFTVIEQSLVVRDIVFPTVDAALDVPLTVHIGEVGGVLAGPVAARYDTIFLDTWDNIDPVYLPGINRLRDQAARHLAPDGRVLLWGYRWMVRLFADACRVLLAVPPDERRGWLERQAGSPPAMVLLAPVVEHFAGQRVDDPDDRDAALAWCRRYAVEVTSA